MQKLISLLAVIVGYLVFALSAVALFQATGRDPHAVQPIGFELSVIGYGAVFAGAGGWLTARLAPSRPALHGTLLALLIAVGATVSLLTSPATAATWSQWGALLVMAPSAWLGARMRARDRASSA